MHPHNPSHRPLCPDSPVPSPSLLFFHVVHVLPVEGLEEFVIPDQFVGRDAVIGVGVVI